VCIYTPISMICSHLNPLRGVGGVCTDKPRKEKSVLRRPNNYHTLPLWKFRDHLLKTLDISINECDFSRVDANQTLGDDVEAGDSARVDECAIV